MSDTETRTVWDLARGYYEARGLPWREWEHNPRGEKLREEADELVEALADLQVGTGDRVAVWEEIGDVANALAYIAWCHGITVEKCMALKTEKDRGRGIGKNKVGGQ